MPVGGEAKGSEKSNLRSPFSDSNFSLKQEESMDRVLRSVIVAAGLVFMLGGATSWGQVPATNDQSDTHGNTGGGTGALVSAIPGSPSSYNGSDNTAYGAAALS